MRISGITIPNKRVVFALTALYGIGPSRSSAILKKAKIDSQKKADELTAEEENAIRKQLEGLKLEGKRKLDTGILFVEATFNNTKVCLGDKSGNIVTWSSSGSLGFSGAKKGTPFAAAKVGELIGERATAMGVKDVSVVVSGVGAGRESSIRALDRKST